MDDILEKQVKFFNIFKETAANNISLIKGFKHWANKIYFTTNGDDLLIHVPGVFIKYGSNERMTHYSKRKKEADNVMGKKTYTFLEYVIKTSCMIYAAGLEKQVATVGGFYKKGNGK